MTRQLKLKPHVKKLWLSALRSGKIKQGRNQLRNEYNAMCCLGVLCNVHAQEHPEFAATQTDLERYDANDTHPSENVFKWAFKTFNYNDSLDVEIFKMETDLVTLNDWEWHSFNQIADVIEKHL